MSRKALIIGIDDYPGDLALTGCVNDATSIAELLESHGNGDPNFNVIRLLSNEQSVTASLVDDKLDKLFEAPAETVLLYFAGHGIAEEKTGSGYLVCQDGSHPNYGIGLSALLERANSAFPRIRASVIILDTCQSGKMGKPTGLGLGSAASAIGEGLTILTSCLEQQSAAEFDGHGLFTGLLLDALKGAAANVTGSITPASAYAHIDQTLGPWEQRPVYKANVSSFITLRRVAPRVPLEVLRRLPIYFPEPTSVFLLDPSFEPDRNNVPVHLRNIPVDPDHARIFAELQQCNRHGLVVPVDAEHMYFAAINSTGCRLTALGAHYRRLAELKRII